MKCNKYKCRIGNVKLGKYTASLEDQQKENYNEAEWENLSDVESALDNIGIKLRENFNTYKDTEVILAQIGEKWDTLDQVSKNSVVSALFGTRQRELGITLFENWGQVGKYADISGNSYGTAVEKMKAYDDSIEASQKRFKNALEKITLDINGAEVFKWFYDSSTKVIENLEVFATAIAIAAMALKGDFLMSLAGRGAGSILGSLAGLGLRYDSLGANNRGINLTGFGENILNNLNEGFSEELLKKYTIALDKRLVGIAEETKAVYSGLQGKMFTGDFGDRKKLAMALGSDLTGDMSSEIQYLFEEMTSPFQSGIVKDIAALDQQRYNEILENIRADQAYQDANHEVVAASKLLAEKRTEAANGTNPGMKGVEKNAQAGLRNGHFDSNAGSYAALVGAGSLLGMIGTSLAGKQLGSLLGDQGEILGMMLGGTMGQVGGKKFMEGITEAIKATNGTKWKAFWTSSGFLGLASAALSTIGMIYTVFKSRHEKAVKEMREDFKNLSEDFQNMKGGAVNASTYDDLARGVDNFGRNMSLTEEEYQKFLDISNQLAELFPGLVTYTDNLGNSFLGLNGKIGGISGEIEKLIKQAQEFADTQMFNETGGFLGLGTTSVFEESYKEVSKQYKKYQKERDLLSGNLGMIGTPDENGQLTLSQYAYEYFKTLGIDYKSDMGHLENGEIGYTVTVKDEDAFNKFFAETERQIAGLEEQMRKTSSGMTSELDAFFRELERGSFDLELGFDSSYLNGLNEDVKGIIRQALPSNFGVDEKTYKQEAARVVESLSKAFAENPEMVELYYDFKDTEDTEAYLKMREDFKNMLVAAFGDDVDESEAKVLVKYGYTYVGEKGGESNPENWQDDEDYYDRILNEFGEAPISGITKEEFYNDFNLNEQKQLWEMISSGIVEAGENVEIFKQRLNAALDPKSAEEWSKKLESSASFFNEDNFAIIYSELEKIKQGMQSPLSENDWQKMFPNMDKQTANFMKQIGEAVEKNKSLEDAMAEIGERGAEAFSTAVEQMLAYNLKDVFQGLELEGIIDSWKEWADVMSYTADGIQKVSDALAIQNEHQHIGWKSALDLLTVNSQYAQMLEIVDGKVRLKSNAELILAKIQVQTALTSIQVAKAELEQEIASKRSALAALKKGDTLVKTADAQSEATEVSLRNNEQDARSAIQLGEIYAEVSRVKEAAMRGQRVDFNWNAVSAKAKSAANSFNSGLKAQSANINPVYTKEDIARLESEVGTLDYKTLNGTTPNGKIVEENGKYYVIREGEQGNTIKQEVELKWSDVGSDWDQMNIMTGLETALKNMLADGVITGEEYYQYYDPTNDIAKYGMGKKGDSGSDTKKALDTLLDQLKRARELIDKEWEAMLSFDEKTKKDSGTKYFEKMKANLTETIKETRKQMELLSSVWGKTGKDLQGEEMSKKEFMEQMNTYEADLIDLQKQINNLDDEEVEDKKKLLETQEASLDVLIEIQKEYLETADTLEEYVEREQELNDLLMERFELAKKISEFRKNQYETELQYFDGLAISDPQYEATFDLYQQQIEAQIDTILEQRKKAWSDAYKRMVTVEGKSPEEAEKLADTDEKVMELTEEYWSKIQERGDAIVKRITDRIAELDREIDIHERRKPKEWSNFDDISKYGEKSIELLERKAKEIKKALEDTSLLTDEQINSLVDDLNSVTEALKDTKEQMLQEEIDYQDKQFNALINRIESFKDDLEEEKDKVNEYYDDLIGNLQDEADAREDNNRLMELELALKNSLNQKQRVYRSGIGWVKMCPRTTISVKG